MGLSKRDGADTAYSNRTFDEDLRARDPLWGVRCLDTEVVPLAEGSGFALHEVVTMPANNLNVIFRRRRDPFTKGAERWHLFDADYQPLLLGQTR